MPVKLSTYLKNTYGEKIYRLSLSSGCSCPNRDGSIGYGGCSFCSEGGSGEFAQGPDFIRSQGQSLSSDFFDIDAQIERAKELIKRNSRHYAKRQLTWFRREKDVTMINKKDHSYDDDKILEYMTECINKSV